MNLQRNINTDKKLWTQVSVPLNSFDLKLTNRFEALDCQEYDYFEKSDVNKQDETNDQVMTYFFMFALPIHLNRYLP